MKGIDRWNFAPVCRFSEPETALRPTICALSPRAGGFGFETFDRGREGERQLLLRRRGTEEWRPVSSETRGTVTGLEDGADYEVKLVRVGAPGESLIRLVRPGYLPGDTVVNYLHPEDKAYAFSGYCLCSPFLTRLPSRTLIATMDVFGPEYPQNLAFVFASEDEGRTWHYRTELYPCFWPSTFVQNGALYCVAMSQEYGGLQIGRSEDEGRTWTRPSVLIPGGMFKTWGPHRAPMPWLRHHGRIWSTLEYGSWKIGCHATAMMSAPEDADLLDPASWSFTEFANTDITALGVPVSTAGAIEGSPVIAPDGRLLSMYRLDLPMPEAGYGKMLVLATDPRAPERRQTVEGIYDVPTGCSSKSVIQYDPAHRVYLCIGNEAICPSRWSNRTVLSLCASEDLRHWRVIHRIFDYRREDPSLVGLQYPSWIFDGEDLLLLTRVAYNGAESFHNANCITFTRIADYAQYLNGEARP